MLRFTFVGGYALFILLVIALMALKVISVVDDGWMGEGTKALNSVLFTAQNIAISAIALGGLFIAWLAALIVIAKRSPEWEKKWVKTLIIGCAFMSGFFLFLGIVGASVFLLDGFAGEVAAKIAGYMSSPVFMEVGFFCIGLVLLFSFNIVRRLVEGDDFVEIEIPNHLLQSGCEENGE